MFVEKQKYKQLLKVKKDFKLILKNTGYAFIFGGIICLIGQILLYMFLKANLDKKLSASLMSMTVVIIAALLSAFGVYDRIGQIAKAGSVIPISGDAR